MSFNFGADVFGNAVGDSILILGNVVLNYVEIPDKFNFGGEQLIKVHQLLGGARVIDALGRSDADITFSGMFFGTNAAERARAVDYLRTQGNAIEFIFGEFIYLVIIKSYSPVFERYYQVPYSITLTVINNLTLPVPVPLALRSAPVAPSSFPPRCSDNSPYRSFAPSCRRTLCWPHHSVPPASANWAAM